MRSGWEGRAWRAVSLALPVILFAIVLRMRLPYGLLIASYFLATPLLLPFGLALWCCHLRRDWIGTISGLAVTLVLFGLPLASLWWHIGTHYNAVGGLLPFSDASGYYYDARRLLQGYPFDWSARRPLFPGLLSTLLALTGDNLQVTLAMLVAFNGVATYLLARELRASHGAAAAAVSTMVLFFFYRVDGGLGTALTENLGFGMGAIAFAVLWRSSRVRDLFGVSLGLGLLTIALMARAGAFFVLPVLVLAVALAFREKWLRAGIVALAAVSLSAGLTLFVSRLLSNPSGGQTAFSNFSLSLYGLVVGGKGWNQVLLDHPGAAEGAQIYSLAWQAFRAHPMGIVEGSLKMWATYFQPVGPHHVFAFVQDGMYGAWLQIVCYILCAIGLSAAVRKRRDAPQALILAAALGHVASIPFVPPIDAGLRVYAATVPMIAILVSIGAAEVLHGIRHLRRIAAPAVVSVSHVEPEASSGGRTAGVIGIAVAAFVFVGPLAVLYTARSPELPSSSCPDGAKAVFVGLSAGSFLRIADDRLDLDGPPLPVPAIGQSDMRASASATELRNDAERFTAGQTMANGYDLKTGRLVWLVAPTEGQLSTSSGVFQVCGHDTLDPLSRNYAVFYGRAVALVARDQSFASRLLWAASLLATACLAWFTGLAFSRADRRPLTAARGWLTSLFANAARAFEGRGWSGGFWRAASLAIPVAVFVAVVRHSFAPRTLVASYSSVLPIVLPAGITLWCCHLRRDWLGTLASLTVTLALFALPLAALWQHFGIHYNAIGGLLPFSDASGYYYDARRLIDGHPLGWSARRPSFVGFLSTTARGDRGQLDCLRRALRGAQRRGDLPARAAAADHPRSSRRRGRHCLELFLSLPSGGWARDGADREPWFRLGCRGLRHSLARAPRGRRSKALAGTWRAHGRLDVPGRSLPGSAGSRHRRCLGLPARPAVGAGRFRRRRCRGSCSSPDARAREDSVESCQLAKSAVEFLVCALRPGCWWQGLGTGHG